MHDLRYSLRTLARSRGFVITAMLSLALGIGANCAIFSLVNAIILRPLAYREPNRLVVLTEVILKLSHLYPTTPVMAGHFTEWRRHLKSFEHLAAIEGLSFNLTGAGEPERLGAARVSATFFPMLGLAPAIGRGFLEEEDQPGRDRVVILSDSLWRRRFQADPGIVGRSITLDGQPFVVVGVLPRGVTLPRGRQLHSLVALAEPVELFKPMAFTKEEIAEMGDFNYGVLGRLRAGVTAEQAVAELNVLQANLAKQFAPIQIELRARIEPLQATLVGDTRKGLLVLMAAVGFVLLIVCANLANLMLTRATARRHELAIRTALGASRGRIVRQMLAESLTVALAGGALGVLAAYWIVDLLIRTAPVNLPRLEEAAVDAPVLLFALLASILTGVLFGVAPAWRAAGLDPLEALQAGSRTGEGPRGARLRAVLVSVEVALSTVLLVGAGLLLSSLVRLLRVDRGFEAHSVISVDLALPESKYTGKKSATAFYRQVLHRLHALPGVLQAAVINILPLTTEGNISTVTIEGNEHVPLIERPIANFRYVSPAYFQAMGISLRAGRAFDYGDGDQRLVVVSEKTAHRLWPGRDPIGRQLRRGDEKQPLMRVVGVVGDIRHTSLAKEPELTAYIPFWHRHLLQMTAVVRAATDPRALASVIRREIWQVDGDVPIPEMKTVEQVVSESVGQRRFQMLLILLFAATALAVAAVGIYGVVSYTVEQRRHEIGIRLALGAQVAHVRRLVVKQAILSVAGGLAVGLAGSLALGRLLQSLLFEVRATDAGTYASVVALLALTALAACYLPGRRATRVDTMAALRYE